MDWTDAWERDKYEVGRAMHEGWKRQKIANGFADHPFVPFEDKRLRGYCAVTVITADQHRCWMTPEKHHDDMTDWDALPPHQQAINFSGGMEGYRMGYEAGLKAKADATTSAP